MLQACLNGGRGAPAPATRDACAGEAAAAVAAGAQEVHIHPRDADGAETLAPEHVAAWLDAVRAAIPGVPVGIGTGAWIAPGGRARLADIEGWTVRPDYVSVNLGEEDAPEVMALMRARDIGIEAGIWSQADARRFMALPDRRVRRILIEMADTDAASARTEALAICDIVQGAAPILLHGDGGSAWPMLRLAAARGHQMRIGLEDAPHLPDGRPAPDNASLIHAAREIIADAAA